MMTSLRRKRVPIRDNHCCEPPNRRRRFIPTLAVGVTLLVGGVVPTTSFAATLEGIVFNDKDGDSLKGADESVRPNETIYIRNNTLVQAGKGGFFTTRTDANGHYSSIGHSAGSLTVWAMIPWGWEQTVPKPGKGAVFYTFDLAGDETKKIDFGFTEPPPNRNPTAHVGETEKQVNVGESANFTAIISDPDGDDMPIFGWDFGDGNKADNTLTVDHTYTSPGTYTAVFTVKDDEGAEGKAEITVTVNNVLPTVGIGIDPSKVISQAPVTFTADVNDTDGDTHTYSWEFGDTKTSTLPNPTHTYMGGGTYPVKLKVTDNHGGIGTATTTIVIDNATPIVDAFGNVATITAGDTVNFNGKVTDGDPDDTHTFKWEFSDGNTATTQNASHAYKAAGTYTATLTVTDSQGGIGADTLKITVNGALPIITKANANFTTVDVNEEVKFSGSFTDADGGTHNYLWVFGDGNAAVGEATDTKAIDVTHKFSQSGDLTAVLQITDSDGNKDQAELKVHVRGIDTNPCEDGVATVRSQIPIGYWFTNNNDNDNDSITWGGTVPNENDWVLIQEGHTVILPFDIPETEDVKEDEIHVKGICIAKGGVLQSAYNQLGQPPSRVRISAVSIRNQGIIRGSDGIGGGGPKNDLALYEHAIDGSSLLIYVNRFVNDATGQVLWSGQESGRGGDDKPYEFFENEALMNAKGGNGGKIEIYPAIFTNTGQIQAGDGGDADAFESFSNWVDGDAIGGDGGFVRVFATNLAMSTNGASGQFKGGCGGNAEGVGKWATTTITTTKVMRRRWWRGWYHWRTETSSSTTGGTRRVVQGGTGGDVSLNLGHLSGTTSVCDVKVENMTLENTVHHNRTKYIRWDPTVLTVDSTTRLEGADEIVLFGGENWTMDLRGLSEGAISANDKITLAVGKGGVIDLRGVSSKVFKADAKLEIFADEVQLDEGVTLKDLAEVSEITVSPSKILYSLEMSYAEHIVGEPGTTVPVKLTLLNGGSTADTYTLNINDSAGWKIGTLPPTVPVNSMRRSELVFNVTLPETRGEENIINITARSQGDSETQAIAEIRIGVKEEERITPRTAEDEKADIILVMDDTRTMASELITVSNALESLLSLLDKSSHTEEETEEFFSQFDEENSPTNEEMEAFFGPKTKEEISTQEEKGPTFELFTFKEDVLSRVVTKDLGDIITRIRSIRPSGGGDCPNASVAAIEKALENINPDGKIILTTASAPHKDAAAAIAKAQEQGVNISVLLAGSCGNVEADKALYKHIADETGGTFSWLPRGSTPVVELEEVISTVVAEVMPKPEPDGDYTASGTMRDELGNPIAGVTLQIGDITIITNEAGYWESPGLQEDEYTITASKDGYTFAPVEFALGNDEFTQTVVMKPLSALNVKVVAEPTAPKQGENITFIATVTNGGSETATGVVLTHVLSNGISLASIEALDGGECDADTVICTLPDLTSGATARVKWVVSNPEANQSVVNTATVTANEYPADVHKKSVNITPHLSVNANCAPKTVMPEGGLHCTTEVVLSSLAPSAATGVEMVMTLPNGVELKSVNTDYGMCDTSELPILTCSLIDLSVDNPDDISRVAVSCDSVLQDPGLLALTHEVKVTANEYPAHTYRERTKVFIPPEYQVDIAIVIDVTGSMEKEMDGTKQAVKNFIATKIDPSLFPLTALVVFRDEVMVKAVTTDLSLVEIAIDKIKASGGGTCPEASVEALDVAITHVKQGGTIFFVTDASPYEDADIVGISERIKAKEIIFSAIITGDCSNRESWNNISE